MNDQQRARERIAKECLNEAKALEKRAKNDRETGDSIQEAIDNDQGVTPDEPQDVAAGLLNDADLAETTAKLLRRAHAALRAAPEWQPIDTAPKGDRVLVRCESGSVYAAHWVQSQMTGEEAWLVCALEDGTQMLVHPVEWMPLPLAARPQGVKDAG